MRIICEPGMTSLASFEQTLILPTISPLFSHADFYVCATICLSHISGLLESTLILYLGLLWPMTAIEPWQRFPPPQIAIWKEGSI